MAIAFPHLERLPRGGAEAWDERGSLLLNEEVFAAKVVSGSQTVVDGGVLLPNGLALYLNAGVMTAKAAAGGGDKRVRFIDGKYTTR